jgi:hypothetical protein
MIEGEQYIGRLRTEFERLKISGRFKDLEFRTQDFKSKPSAVITMSADGSVGGVVVWASGEAEIQVSDAEGTFIEGRQVGTAAEVVDLVEELVARLESVG